MAGMIRAGGTVVAEPNVLPLIDVLLVLLVFFMMVNARVRQAIPLQVPPPATSGGQSQIVLDLPGESGFAINGQPILDAQLETVLGSIFGNRPTKLLFVRASEQRTYQEVISAMDRARGAGIQVIGLVPRG